MCTNTCPTTPEIDDVLMIEPRLACCITGTTARMPKNTPRALTVICSSHTARLSRSGSEPLTPALLTRMSIVPHASSVASTAAVHCSALDTSRCWKRAMPPACVMMPTTASPSLSFMSAHRTLAPSAAKIFAVDAPMPDAAPVTMAILSLRRMAGSSRLRHHRSRCLEGRAIRPAAASLACRDRLDLQQEIGVGEPAQDAQRAAGRVTAEIGQQHAARLRHVVRVADADRDLDHVGDFRPAGGERVGKVRHHHRGLGVEIVRRQHLAVRVRRHLAGAKHQLLRALGRHHVRIVGERLVYAVGVDPADLRHGVFSVLSNRHGRPGHFVPGVSRPSTSLVRVSKTWMPGTRACPGLDPGPGMTTETLFAEEKASCPHSRNPPPSSTRSCFATPSARHA